MYADLSPQQRRERRDELTAVARRLWETPGAGAGVTLTPGEAGALSELLRVVPLIAGIAPDEPLRVTAHAFRQVLSGRITEALAAQARRLTARRGQAEELRRARKALVESRRKAR